MMPTTLTPPPDQTATAIETCADLLHRLGDIPPERVRIVPPIGTATVQDVIDIHAREKRLFELVDGILVEKGMGFRESALASFLVTVLLPFVQKRNLGLVTGADGMMRLFGGLVRIPDAAFVSWARIPSGRMPTEPVPHLVPDLAVEVLSPSNTVSEMERKRREYFQAGVRLVWIINADTRTVAVYTAPENPVVLNRADTLDGGDVLPGFALSLTEYFAELDRQAK